MAEAVHIRVDFSEAVSSKKDLLSCQLDLLKITKNLKNYKKFRKKELANRAKMKTKLKSVATDIKHLRENMPKTSSAEKEKKEAKVEIQKKVEKGKLESELKDIRERLEHLAEASA